MLVELRFLDREPIQEQLPDFPKLPEVLLWNHLAFVLAEQNAATGVPVYAWAVAYQMPQSTTLPPPAPTPSIPPPFPELAVEPADRTQRVSTSGRVVDPSGPVPDPEMDSSGQHAGYWVLSDAERAKGFVRPVRGAYRHVGIPGPRIHCGI